MYCLPSGCYLHQWWTIDKRPAINENKVPIWNTLMCVCVFVCVWVCLWVCECLCVSGCVWMCVIVCLWVWGQYFYFCIFSSSSSKTFFAAFEKLHERHIHYRCTVLKKIQIGTWRRWKAPRKVFMDISLMGYENFLWKLVIFNQFMKDFSPLRKTLQLDIRS